MEESGAVMKATIDGYAQSTLGLLLMLAPLALVAGCEPVAVTALGVGASTGVSQTLGGITYRTFTVPLPRVRGAALAALNRMSIKVESSRKTEDGELIKANATDRQIEVELEALTPNTTRMRTVAKKGSLLYDSATAIEIILQTEKMLGTS